MAVSAQDIQRLRNSTGVGMMAAKSALEEAAGEFEKAVMVLRQKGQATAAKKSGREAKAGLIDSYLHMGRVGVLLEVNCETDFVARTDDFKQFTHNLAMHIAAANPLYVNKDDVPPEVVAKESELYEAEAKQQNKPPEVAAKIVEGKLQKFYREVCLLKQPSIRDDSQTVEAVLTELIAKLGENIVISRFARLELGSS